MSIHTKIVLYEKSGLGIECLGEIVIFHRIIIFQNKQG